MNRDTLPEKLTSKWQVTVDLMRQFFEVPAALINRFVNGNIRIEVSGKGGKEYFKSGDSSKAGTGHYCDEVFITGEQVYIKNANKTKKWSKTPSNTKGMVCYLGTPIKWSDGTIFGTLCVLDLVERDFDPKYLALLDQFKSIIESDLIQWEEELNQKISNVEIEKKYNLLAANLEDVIWTFNLERMRFSYISPSVEKLRGYSVEEAMGQSFEESLSPEAFHLLNDELKNRLKDFNDGVVEVPTRYRYEVQQPHKDGELVWVEMNTRIVFSEDGRPKEIFGVTRDISERRVAEDRIKENERQLSVIFNNAPSMMVLINENTEILKINHVGLKMVGSDELNTINFKPGDILKCINSIKTGKGCGASDDCSNCMLRGTFTDTMNNGRSHFKVEVTLNLLRDGQYIDVPVSVSSSIVSTFPEKKVLLTIDDISDRKRLENDLVKAKEHAEESDRLKTSFLTNMSHEIRTPLNGIIGFSQIITDSDIKPESRSEYSEIIHKSAQQLLSIVNNIIEISRVETDQIQLREIDVNLNKLLDEVCFFYRFDAETKGLQINVMKGLPDDRCEITTDPVLLRKIFENLTDNAIKFTDSGIVKIGYKVDKDRINFFVEDSGVGIEAVNKEIIFDRFIKVNSPDGRQFGGNGLGLSVSKAYSEKLGGNIYFEAIQSGGTRFIFEMPLQKEDLNKLDSRIVDVSEESRIPCVDRTILVVEDEEINYIYTQQILRRLNATVLWAKTGQEAIEIVKKTPDIKLVLMDIKLPDISGYEVTRELVSHFPDLKVIALTAYALAGDREDAIESGCIDYIPKPAKADTMITVISKYC